MNKKLKMPLHGLLEDMMWMSMRYAIGRSSISAQMLPAQFGEFIQENKKELENSLPMFFNDLAREINSQLDFCDDVHLEQFLTKECIISKLLEYMIDHPKTEKEYYYINNGEITIRPMINSNNFQLNRSLVNLEPWIDLLGAFRPTHRIEFVDGSEVDGYISYTHYLTDKKVVYCTCEDYFSNPYVKTYVESKYIKSIKKI